MIVYNLKGLIIANGGTDNTYDLFSKNTPFTYTGFNIFPEYLLKEYEANNCTIRSPLVDPYWEPTPECRPIVLKMQSLHNTGVDIYDLLRMPSVSIFSDKENKTALSYG